MVTKEGNFNGLEELLKVVQFYIGEIIEWCRSIILEDRTRR